MRGIANYFSVSKEYGDVSEISFEIGAFLFHSLNQEERSQISKTFSEIHPMVELVHVQELQDQQIGLFFQSKNYTLSLRSRTDINFIAERFENLPIYIDITGMSHGVWAWLIRAMKERKIGDLSALYTEPLEYKLHDAPLDGQIFDLSERINGIAPLPGLARLTHYRNSNFIFIPLLGFEGTRLSYIMEDVQPVKELTFPVIGVPGFRFDFPFYTYQANRLALEREGIWQNWRYEKANCPMSIYMLGIELMNEYKDHYLRIAPIGTKPHALGALLLKLAFPSKVDIIYDHPIRKKNRTQGKSKTLCYFLNALNA